MKKVLVTGATGFIGEYLINELLKNGYPVIASSSNKSTAIKKSWFNQVNYKPLDFLNIQADINYFDYFGKPDILIHLTWEGLPNYMKAFHLEQNLPRHKIFLKSLIENGLTDITVTGTCFEYGMQEGCLTETLDCNPQNAYGKAKLSLYKDLEKFIKDKPISLKWVRLFYMFGDGQSPKSLISQLDKALDQNEKIFNMSGGQQVRDFLPIEIVAKNLLQIALQNKVEGVINCCSGVPVTIEKFVQYYLNTKQKNITLNLGYYNYSSYEPMAFWGDTNKLNKIIKNE